jgi:Secretion system C-terminal sorting domain
MKTSIIFYKTVATLLLISTLTTLSSQDLSINPTQSSVCSGSIIDYRIVITSNRVVGLTLSTTGGGVNANNGSTGGFIFCGFGPVCPFAAGRVFSIPIQWSSAGTFNIVARDGNGNVLSTVTCNTTMLQSQYPYLSGPSVDYNGTQIYSLNTPDWNITGVSFQYNSTGASISSSGNTVIIENMISGNYYVPCFTAQFVCGTVTTSCSPLFYGGGYYLKQNINNTSPTLTNAKNNFDSKVEVVKEASFKPATHIEFWDDNGQIISKPKDSGINVSVYPNPVSKDVSFNLTISGMEGASKDGTVLNMQGQVVRKFKVDEKNTNIQIMANDLISGIYIVKIQSAIGEATTKFVVQN